MTIVGQVPAPPLAQRVCGRCRKLFDGDPALHAGAIPDWWVCGPCRISLKIDRDVEAPPC